MTDEERTRIKLADCVHAFEHKPTLENAAFLQIALYEKEKLKACKVENNNDKEAMIRSNYTSANYLREFEERHNITGSVFLQIAIQKIHTNNLNKKFSDTVSEFEHNQTLENAAFLQIALFDKIENNPDGSEARETCRLINSLNAFSDNQTQMNCALVHLAAASCKFGTAKLYQSEISKTSEKLVEICRWYTSKKSKPVVGKIGRDEVIMLLSVFETKPYPINAARLQVALSSFRWRSSKKICDRLAPVQKRLDAHLFKIINSFLEDNDDLKTDKQEDFKERLEYAFNEAGDSLDNLSIPGRLPTDSEKRIKSYLKYRAIGLNKTKALVAVSKEMPSCSVFTVRNLIDRFNNSNNE